MLICCLVTITAIRIVKKEQRLKVKLGRELLNCDIRLEGKTLVKLVVFAFLGGWVSGALGQGGGSIFNPVLLSMGVPPAVASSTGMYMIMFSTAGSSIVYILNGMLKVDYAFWISAWCIVGSIFGLIMLKKLLQMYNRQSPIVMVLAFILGLSAVLVPLFGTMDLIEQANRGKNIMQFRSMC